MRARNSCLCATIVGMQASDVKAIAAKATGIPLADLKKIFKVSVACLAVRCAQLGVLSKAAYAKLWRHLMALGWNGPASKEPYPLPPEVPQRMERLCFRAVSEGAVSESRAAELMKISVRELDRRLTAQCA